MKIIKLDSGAGCDLHAIEKKNKCLVLEYISSLQKIDRNKTLALLNYVLANGTPRNKRKFRALGDGIWELKPSSKVRILCFFGDVPPGRIGRQLILTHGLKKDPKKKKLQQEKDKALNWLRRYFDLHT